MAIEVVAAAVLEALAARRQIAPFADLTMAEAYRVAALVRDARAPRVVGRKIGFTNRTIWDEYGVHAPIWGYVYDSTLHDLAEPARAGDFVEPRIEPEIVFGLGADLRPGDDVAAKVAWVAHGYEIVQSLYPGWRFAAPDTVAAFGLHAGLWIGPRRPLRPDDDLETFEIELLRNDELMDRGRAANVLDGPLHAFAHLVDVLKHDPDHPPLAAGEIVTTGTLTRAFPIAPGEVWTTQLSGLDLPGARLVVT